MPWWEPACHYTVRGRSTRVTTNSGLDATGPGTTLQDVALREGEDRNGKPAIDLYLIQTRGSGVVLFATRRSLISHVASEKDRFLRLIRRMMRSRNSVVRWVGRVSRAGHRYYQKLEDRIDPLERMVKALNYPGALRVWHAPGRAASSEFSEFLRWQATKHMTWLVLDGVVTGVAVLLAPFTVPIPGPNVFFFYPFLRLLSHAQALRGVRRALRDRTIRFEPSEDLRWIEHGRDLRDRGEFPEADSEVVEGVNEFLKRIGRHSR